MGTNLLLCQIESPIGPITLALEADAIVICEFSDREERVAKQLRRYYSGATIVKGQTPENIKEAFQSYFDGNNEAFDSLEARPVGTDFERSVWHTLKEVSVGTTASYGDIARRLGSSPRAVGRANGNNPVCLIYPCHRVIGADGSLTGYAGGLDRKEWLLKHEGALLPL